MGVVCLVKVDYTTKIVCGRSKVRVVYSVYKRSSGAWTKMINLNKTLISEDGYGGGGGRRGRGRDPEKSSFVEFGSREEGKRRDVD